MVIKKRGKNNYKKSSDTPRETKGVEPTGSHPIISIGTGERDLLRFMFSNKDKRFNLRDYALNISKIPRSTVYDYINKLEREGLIKKDIANNKISEKGIILLQAQENMGVGSSRSGCREINKLSTHFHKFKLPISSKNKFSMFKLKRLNPTNIKENKLHNLHQIIVHFDDATILINPKQLIINLYDVITDNVEESDFQCLSRAVEYAKKFMSIGIETEGIFTEEGHWARIKSMLSDFLYDKIDNKYYLDLGNGKHFWIDYSPDKYGIPKREDETNDKEVRERIDNFLGQVASDDFDLQDINKIKNSLGFITKLETARLTDKIEETKLKRIELEKQTETKLTSDYNIPSYLG